MIRIGMLALALGAALTGAANAQTATALTANAQADLVKRGDYLVNGIMTLAIATRRKDRRTWSPARSSPADRRLMCLPSR